MLPYPMRQARRALIRRALAATPVDTAPEPDDQPKAPASRRRASTARRRPPPVASRPGMFAHLNTPEAAAQLRAWIATRKKD